MSIGTISVMERATGDELAQVFAALANPHRMRILAALVERRLHVSQLARQVGLSRPLVHMHLRKLEDAGLVTSDLVLSEEGRAMRVIQVVPFSLQITPELVAAAVRSLTDRDPNPSETKEDKEK